MTAVDALVVGAGFAGSVVAERLATAGRRVLVVDRRDHIGGNAFDEPDAHGVLVHRYGPHIFHTNSDDVVRYLSRFTAWRAYEHRVLAAVDGVRYPFPINRDTVNRLYGLNLDDDGVARFLAGRAEPRARIDTAEDAVVAKIGRDLYERFFLGYTRKQWGRDPSQLSAQVTARVPARATRDDRYFADRFQAMPRDGYAALFRRLLDHPKIEVRLETPYRDIAPLVECRRLVWTGPVDEWFGHRLGRLPYRSLRFRFETVESDRPIQPVATINYPDPAVTHTRVTEFRHLTGQRCHRFTTLAYETPCADGDPYYPVPSPESAALARAYADLAEREAPGVVFAGRLGTYRYYNMDQVIAQALALSRRLLDEAPPALRTATRHAA